MWGYAYLWLMWGYAYLWLMAEWTVVVWTTRHGQGLRREPAAACARAFKHMDTMLRNQHTAGCKLQAPLPLKLSAATKRGACMYAPTSLGLSACMSDLVCISAAGHTQRSHVLLFGVSARRYRDEVPEGDVRNVSGEAGAVRQGHLLPWRRPVRPGQGRNPCVETLLYR